VQFHPESILSASGRAGHQVIGNVLRLARARSLDAVVSTVS
jgi:anthranilate synthase